MIGFPTDLMFVHLSEEVSVKDKVDYYLIRFSFFSKTYLIGKHSDYLHLCQFIMQNQCCFFL